MPSSLGLGLPRFSTRPGQRVGCLVTTEVPVVRMCFLGLGNVMCPSASSLLEAWVAIGFLYVSITIVKSFFPFFGHTTF